jgi:lysozyme
MGAAELLAGLIRRFEGLRLQAYQCPAGVWTCGWGSTGPDVTAGTRWTRQEADARMAYDAAAFLAAARRRVPTADTPGRQAALADFAYNLGLSRLAGSTLRKRALAGDWAGVQIELQRWVRGGGRVLPGLVARRQAEARLVGKP